MKKLVLVCGFILWFGVSVGVAHGMVRTVHRGTTQFVSVGKSDNKIRNLTGKIPVASVSRGATLRTSSVINTSSDNSQDDHALIPSTSYVSDYLGRYCLNSDLKLNNVAANKLPSERYLMGAIDYLNMNETNYVDDARDNGNAISMNYLKSSVDK